MESYLEAHGLLVAALAALLILGVSYRGPATETISRLISPARSSYKSHEPPDRVDYRRALWRCYKGPLRVTARVCLAFDGVVQGLLNVLSRCVPFLLGYCLARNFWCPSCSLVPNLDSSLLARSPILPHLSLIRGTRGRGHVPVLTFSAFLSAPVEVDCSKSSELMPKLHFYRLRASTPE